jgi:O-antigen ligase
MVAHDSFIAGSSIAGTPPRVMARGGSDRIAFWTAVLVALAFSQCWVMPLTGPGPDPIDPAVSASIRNYYFPVYGVVLAFGLTRPMALATALARTPLLCLLLAVPFISAAWSIAPDVTLRRSVAALFTTLAGVVIAARFGWRRFTEVLAAAFAVVAALCFVFALLMPSYGRMATEFPGAWRGVWGHKNTLGYNMAIGFSVFAAAALASPARRWLWAAAGVGAFVLVILSQSKTSLVSLLAGAACIGLVLIARRGPAAAVAATFLGGTAAIAGAGVMAFAPDLVFGLLGKDSTFTGRTKIWAAVMHQIEKRPITGYGYGAVWDDQTIWGPFAWISKEQGFVIHEAHNSWLGIWLELGYVGLAAWSALFVELWGRTLLAVYTRPVALLALPVLAMFSLHALTESQVLIQNDWLWMLLAAIAVKLAAGDEGRDGPWDGPWEAP